MKKCGCGPVGVFFCVLLLAIPGCGKKRPVNLGEADITALGAGVGRELREEVERGDLVLVFGIPHARANAESMELAIIRGLEHQLKDIGVKVQRVRYTDEEYDAYMRGRYESLHGHYAATAMSRYQEGSPRVIMSLVGWPTADQSFLPRDILFVGVSWAWGEEPSTWLRMFDRVMVVNSLHGPITGRPSRHALRNPGEVLNWFEERFEVLKGGA